MKKKILVLGTNDVSTDIETSHIAKTNNSVNHGLIADESFVPELPGYYHTSIIDLSFGAIVALAKNFDIIRFLDQPSSQWSHWKLLLSSYKLMVELDRLRYCTVYKDNANIKKYTTFDNIFETNKSFCIYPWINMIEEGGNLVACARSNKKIIPLKELDNWQTNSEYTKIREKMLKGETMPDRCSRCYNYEEKGIESYRIFESKEWISKLNIESFDDLHKITQPYYYEIRLSNKCNIMCRSCKPEYSHLIEKEFKTHGIIYPAPQTYGYSSLDLVNINTISPKTRIYLTGGEPTVMSEVLTFMRNCIDAGKTDFDFTLGTNAVSLSNKFLELSDHFTNMNFSVSLDGYGKINDYWRSGSDWETVIRNTKLLESRGHTISINTVPGIYNVTNLHLLFEFLDQEFPHAGVYLQINRLPIQSAFNHPNSQLVVESMEKCRQTKIYYSDGKSNRTCIDSLYDHYSKDPKCNLKDLQDFFEYNDRLDFIRGVYLKDYIPELEACRSYLRS